MGYFPFIWEGNTSLACELTIPFRRVSLGIVEQLGEAFSLTLWRDDGSGITIYSQMQNVAEWLEVGVLTFELVNACSPNDRIVVLPKEFDAPITVMKLLKEEAGSTLESGVILEAANGSQIIVVAAVFPYNIAVQGVIDDLPRIFKPEYPLESYTIIPM